jgi:mannitol 2-dehydrogenase
MGDRLMAALIAQFLEHDAAPLLTAPPGMETGPYAASLERRYRNPAINDQLLRIAGDGASKLPVYIRDTTAGVLAAGGDARRLAFLLAAFTEYLRGVDDEGAHFEVVEPFITSADRALAEATDLTAALRMSPFAGWGVEAHPAFVAAYGTIRHGIREQGARATLAALLAHQPAGR